MAKKAVKKPVKVKKSTKLPEFNGVQIAEIGEKIIERGGNDVPTGIITYHCRFVDGSFKQVPSELLEKFIK